MEPGGAGHAELRATDAAAAAELLEVAIAAARAAGAELLDRYHTPSRGVRTKRRASDWVSDADIAAERLIARTIAERRPGDELCGEEASADRRGTSGVWWLVDPLDGTANFLMRIPLWCVSVSCGDALGTCAGVVFDPLRGELFAAARGGTATLNGSAVRGGTQRTLEAATVGGYVQCFSGAEAARHQTIAGRLYPRVGHRRSLGSAALELSWTAAGRLDICYQEQDLEAWDVDAGLFICRQAGLRTYSLAPAGAGLSARYLVAPAALARDVIPLVSHPTTSERPGAPRLTPERVRETLDQRRR
jgi:myo-inositol-1(or 4)-monophosphatase